MDHELYQKIGEVTRYIDMTLRRLERIESPATVSADQLPQATAHIRDLAKMTEDGTLRVMELTEAIQETRWQAVKALEALSAPPASHQAADYADRVQAIHALLAEDDKRLVDIMTALSFQDLVAQRITKVVTILEDVEHRLLEIIVVFGDKQGGAKAGDGSTAASMIRQLEASKHTSLKQELVDDILGQYGFV
jgi:chemotaxis protein CheZ